MARINAGEFCRKDGENSFKGLCPAFPKSATFTQVRVPAGPRFAPITVDIHHPNRTTLTMDTSGIIALSFIALIGIVLLVAMFVFKSVDALLKLWAGLGTIATAIVTFYFTNGTAEKKVESAQREKIAALAATAKAEGALAATTRELSGVRFNNSLLKERQPVLHALLMNDANSDNQLSEFRKLLEEIQRQKAADPEKGPEKPAQATKGP
jgi:hypothetical protein